MKICEICKLDLSNINTTNQSWLIRVDPEDLSTTLKEIFMQLKDMSWLNKLEFKPLRDSFEERAKITCDHLKEKLLDNSTNDNIKENAGEYIVSNLSKTALIVGMNHTDIPLMELLGRKRTNNPGFDFYTEKDKLLVAGEAKYIDSSNAYNSSLKQIYEFINQNKHIQDIALLMFFTNDESLENLNQNKFNICAAFSSTQIKTSDLINNIKKNDYFKKCIEQHDVFLVAVNMYEN